MRIAIKWLLNKSAEEYLHILVRKIVISEYSFYFCNRLLILTINETDIRTQMGQ